MSKLPVDRNLLRLLLPQRSLVGELAGLFALTIIVPLFEVASAASIGPFILLAQWPNHFPPGRVGRMAQLVAGSHPEKTVLFAGLVVATLFAVKTALVLLQGRVVQRYARDYQQTLSNRLLRGYLAMPFEFHAKNNSAILIRNVTTETQIIVDNLLVQSIAVVSELLVVVLLLTLLLFVDPWVSLVEGACLIAALVALRLVAKFIGTPSGRRREEAVVRLIKIAQTALTGVREISVGGGGGYLLRRFDQAVHTYVEAAGIVQFLGLVPRAVLEAVAIIAILVVMMVNTAAYGGANFAIIAIFIAAGYRILPSINRIYTGTLLISYMMPSLVALAPSLLVALKVADAPSDAPVAPEPFTELGASGIEYRYGPEDQQVLSHADLTLRLGEMIGLEGPSGAGKTTLINILVGLLPAQKGIVRLNGRDISSPADMRVLRDGASYVPQSVFIADDTLINNITLGAPQDQIDKARLSEALAISQLEEFIAQLPEGLETPIGERGARVSGGEAQRVGIARALYRSRQLLVLDEATSALDAATERRLMDALRAGSAGRAVLVVSHRPSALADCDRIYRLAAGHLRCD